MPEIVEVRKNADFIKKKLKNQKIIQIEILNGRYKNKGPFKNYLKLKQNLPLKLLDIKTKGKVIIMLFDNNLYLINRLGLMGGWCFISKNDKISHPDIYDYYLKYSDKNQINTYMSNSLAHLNFHIETNQGKLYFYDIISYGTLECVDNLDDLEKILNSIGPDIMDKSMNLEIFTNCLRKKTNLEKPIGNVIVNQKIISGLGNYLRADILWLAKINPFRKTKTLTDIEISNIFKYTRDLTWGNYNKEYAIKQKIIKKNIKLPYDYNRLFFIYFQTTDIHSNPVIKSELYDGTQCRYIYWVPNIQK